MNKEYETVREMKKECETAREMKEEEVRKMKSKRRQESSIWCNEKVLPSEELSYLIGIPNKSYLTMEEITTKFLTYVKTHNLISSDKKHIIPNENLIDLFNLKETDVIAYYNYGKYIYNHVKKV